MIGSFVIIAILIGVGAIVIILKKGFNEVISGLNSIDDRLRDLEEKLNKN